MKTNINILYVINIFVTIKLDWLCRKEQLLQAFDLQIPFTTGNNNNNNQLAAVN